MATSSVLDRIRALSGIDRAALSESGPLSGGGVTTSVHYPGEYPGDGLYVEGQQGNQLTSSKIYGRAVSPDFFAALGIKILKGRGFGPANLLNSSTIAIVSESFARKYIPGSPLGKRFSVSTDEQGNHEWMTIIGEVNDVRDRAVNKLLGDGPVYYIPYCFGNKQWEVIARTSVSPTAVVPAIERIVRSVDPDAPITHIETVDQIIAQSAAQPRFQTILLGSFGALGLLLAIIGTYGVIAYSVVQRTHEIGVRMALGTHNSDILRMVLSE